MIGEVKHGKWIDKGSLSCRCSNCGCKSTEESKFCSNCGADMRVDPRVDPDDYAKDNIRLYDFLRRKTEVHWLCFITYKGWGQCVAYIDHEDLMTTSIPKKYLNMIVKEVKFAKREIANAYGRHFEVPVLEVEVDGLP